MAGLGYKLFASGEVLTAANLQGYAVDQSTMVFASSAARTTALASPSEGMVSYLLDSNCVEVYDGSAWKRLLNTTGSILQVVSAKYSTQTSNSTNTYADTGLTATITPYSTASKIAVLVVHSSCHKTAANASNAIEMQLLRGATQVGYAKSICYTNTAVANTVGTSLATLDAPATTSATTYKTQFRNEFNGAAVTVQLNSSDSTIVLMEVAA